MENGFGTKYNIFLNIIKIIGIIYIRDKSKELERIWKKSKTFVTLLVQD